MAVVPVLAGSAKGVGSGVPYSVAVAGLGGTAPMIRHALEDHYAVFSAYVLSCVLVALCATAIAERLFGNDTVTPLQSTP